MCSPTEGKGGEAPDGHAKMDEEAKKQDDAPEEPKEPIANPETNKSN